MSTNCLVTKLKEVVNNSNLPTLNTLFLDYAGSSVDGGKDMNLVIDTGDEAVNVTINYPGNTVNRTIAANFKKLITVTNPGTDPISKFIKIENYYGLKRLCMFGSATSFSHLNFEPTQRNGMCSLLGFGNNLKIYGGKFSDSYVFTENMDGLKEVVVYGNGNIPEGKTAGDIALNIDNLTGCKILYSTTSPMNNPYIQLTDNTALNTNLEVISMLRPVGLLVNVPLNIKVMTIGTSAIEGNIEDLLTRLRGAGRTTGAIRLDWPTSALNVKYTNKAIGTYLEEQGITQLDEGGIYLQWDASTESFTATKPSSLDDYYPVSTPFGQDISEW